MGRLDQLSIAYDRVWQSFQVASATADGRHDESRWREHAGPYAACVVRVDGNALQPELRALLGGIERLTGVRAHPRHFLHVMLQELGYLVDEPDHPDEISRARLEEFALSAIEPVSSMEPIEITLGGANAFQDAVFLEVGGGETLSRLHARLFDLAALPSIPEYPYLPHCTVAHFTGEIPAGEAASAIEPWRDQAFGAISISEVEIVTLDTRVTYPELLSYAVIPLGG